MHSAKPNRTALLIAAAIGILAIGWIVLILFLRSSGNLPEPAKPLSTTEPNFLIVPEDISLSAPVLASEVQVYPKYTREIDYLYDSQGRLVQERWNDGTVTIDYLYHENGNPMAEIKANEQNILYTIDYREDGSLYQMVENSCYQDGTIASTATTFYDERGTILFWSDVAADGRYTTEISYTNEYDSQGRLIRQETRRTSDGTLLHVDTWDYHDGSGWILDSTEYNGDPNDNPVWIHEKRSFNPDGSPHSIFRDIMDTAPCFDLQYFTYDAQGNLTQEVWEMGQPGDEYYSRSVLDYHNTYENGYLVKVETYYSGVQSYDGETEETPARLTETKIWKYDDAGNLLFHDDGTATCTYTYLPLSEVLAP